MTTEQIVRTPPELGRYLVDDLAQVPKLDPGSLVLEPSAGNGALVELIGESHPEVTTVAIETHAQYAQQLAQLGASVYTGAVEDYLWENPESDWPARFDAVVMHPPFTTAENSAAWIDHLHVAWQLLEWGGRLVCLAPASILSAGERKYRGVYSLIENTGGFVALDKEALVGSGTAVPPVALWSDKPLEPQPQRKRRRSKPNVAEKQRQRTADRELCAEANQRLEDEQWVARMQRHLDALPPDCRLASYTQRNQALVVLQAQERGLRLTGHLDTFAGWAKQGRVVAQGQRSLRIVAAMGDEPDTEDQTLRDQQREPRKRFRMASRFDMAQTQPRET